MLEISRDEYIETVRKKSSLKWLIVHEDISGLHPLWKYTETNPHAVTAANVRARMLCGRYKHQALLNTYNPSVSPTCSLCEKEEENTLHMVSKCPSTSSIRTEENNRMRKLFEAEGKQPPETPEELCYALLNGGDNINSRGLLLSLSKTSLAQQASNISNRFCFRVDSFRNSYKISWHIYSIRRFASSTGGK